MSRYGTPEYGKVDGNGFIWVRPTPDEVEDYKAKHRGFPPAVYRAVCQTCDKRIWKSGLGVGAHRKVCSGWTKEVEAAWQERHGKK